MKEMTTTLLVIDKHLIYRNSKSGKKKCWNVLMLQIVKS